MIRTKRIVSRIAISPVLVLLCISHSLAQTWTGTELVINHPTLGDNSDYTAIFRDDSQTDRTHLKIRMGDEYTSDFEIGYQYYGTGLWNTTLKLDGSGNLFIPTSIGIGISGSASQLHLASDADHEFRMSRANGMYGFRIFRDAAHGEFFFQNTDDNNVWGTRIKIEEGGPLWQNLILNPDDGNIGIGTDNPLFKLDVAGFGARVRNPLTDFNTYTTFRVQGPDYTHGLEIDFFGNNNFATDPNASYGGGVGSAAIVNVNPKPLILGTDNQPRIFVAGNGDVAIGTNDPKGYKLAVAGKAVAEEINVKIQATWPDYVFDSHYKIPVLSELEQFILANKHLPDVPTAQEVKQNGLSLGEMNAILLKKVEELTMYMIEQNKRLESQESRINSQEKLIQSLSESLQQIQGK